MPQLPHRPDNPKRRQSCVFDLHQVIAATTARRRLSIPGRFSTYYPWLDPAGSIRRDLAHAEGPGPERLHAVTFAAVDKIVIDFRDDFGFIFLG